jgi:hypothetical protein
MSGEGLRIPVSLDRTMQSMYPFTPYSSRKWGATDREMMLLMSPSFMPWLRSASKVSRMYGRRITRTRS